MAVEKYIIDKSDLNKLLRGEDLAIMPKGNIRGFCVEIAGDLTNGDMIKAMFPYISKYNNMLLKDHSENILFDDSWWNAPYKAESEEV